MNKLPDDYMYPDNRSNTLEHIPGLGMQEIDPTVDILNYITKTKGIQLTNEQIVLLIEILK